MKKSILLAPIFGLWMCISAHAVSTIPAMISEDNPTRIGLSVVETTSFSPLAINELSGTFGLAYGFGGGFEGGFQLRGGAKSDKLFGANSVTDWFLAGDGQIRYLGNVTDFLYIGLQAQFGYAYTFAQANITVGSGMTAAVGLPLGVTFGGDKYAFYAMPELRFGGKTATEPEEVFGSLVALRGVFGAYVYVGGPSLYAEVSPGTKDISKSENDLFVLDATVGIAFDL